MKYLIYMMMLGVLFSCNVDNKSTANEDIVNVSKTLLQDLIGLWESGDTTITENIFLEDCEYTDVANNQTFSGIKGVNKYVSHIHNWASDVKMEIRNINVSENMGFVEWTMTGKQTEPIGGRVLIATNRDIMLNGVTLAEIEGGKINKASDYMDVLGFVVQLGSKIELPGGVVIGG